jgi:hypothetical protein
MKYFSLLFATLAVMVVAGCHPNPANYTHPVGYTPCQTNYDCKGPGHYHEFCGFVGVDTYPVCRQ